MIAEWRDWCGGVTEVPTTSSSSGERSDEHAGHRGDTSADMLVVYCRLVVIVVIAAVVVVVPCKLLLLLMMKMVCTRREC